MVIQGRTVRTSPAFIRAFCWRKFCHVSTVDLAAKTVQNNASKSRVSVRAKRMRKLKRQTPQTNFSRRVTFYSFKRMRRTDMIKNNRYVLLYQSSSLNYSLKNCLQNITLKVTCQIHTY